MKQHERFISDFSEWARNQSAILGTVLVGSLARGTDRLDSDVDLVVITDAPAEYLKKTGWLETFGDPVVWSVEDYGLVQSLRVHYDNGIEAEFGITTQQWLKIDPPDDGTLRVLRDGYRILNDKAGLFKAFLTATNLSH